VVPSRVHGFTGSRVQGSFTRPVAISCSSAALFVVPRSCQGSAASLCFASHCFALLSFALLCLALFCFCFDLAHGISTTQATAHQQAPAATPLNSGNVTNQQPLLPQTLPADYWPFGRGQPPVRSHPAPVSLRVDSTVQQRRLWPGRVHVGSAVPAAGSAGSLDCIVVE